MEKFPGAALSVLYLMLEWITVLLSAAYGSAVGVRLAGDRSIGNMITLIFSGLVLVAAITVTLVYNAQPRELDFAYLDDAGDAKLAVVLSVVLGIIAASIRAQTGGRSYMAMVLALWFTFTVAYMFVTADSWSAQALDVARNEMFDSGGPSALTHEQKLLGVEYKMPGNTALLYFCGSIVCFVVGSAIASVGGD